MTGHQDHAATGKTLKGQVVPAINIMGLCRSLGIEHVYEVDAFDQKELEEVIKREVAREAVFRHHHKGALRPVKRHQVPQQVQGRCLINVRSAAHAYVQDVQR